jgi:hypothetical protein
MGGNAPLARFRALAHKARLPPAAIRPEKRFFEERFCFGSRVASACAAMSGIDFIALFRPDIPFLPGM